MGATRLNPNGSFVDMSNSVITTRSHSDNQTWTTMLSIAGSGILHQIMGVGESPVIRITIDGIVVVNNSNPVGSFLLQKRFKNSLLVEISTGSPTKGALFWTQHSLT